MSDPRFLLLCSPLQFASQDTVKPDGSLGLPYLAGALRDAGFEVRIVDACVGTERDDIATTFFKPVRLPSGLIRVGLPPERIAEEIADFDVIGISSIFTMQTTMVIELIRLIKAVDPRKLVVLGGVNARYLRDRFFAAGADLICLSESDHTIVEIAEVLRRGSRDFSAIGGIAVRHDGKTVMNETRHVVKDLDELPMPAWDLLPLERYWEISRPHGGDFPIGATIRYASMMTSRGCPFSCAYCHISKETAGSFTGEISSLRLKSFDRVLREIDLLKSLGAEYVFFEDDSLLAKKKRILEIFRALRSRGLALIDVNGVNLIHMFRNDRQGGLVVDRELLEGMAECGFTQLSLPFESGSQRIIDTYASSKWNIGACDTTALIRTAKELGIRVIGNYTIGYPDESFEELTETVLFAKRHVAEGLDAASFFIMVPFPGSRLFDMAVAKGHLDEDFDPDAMSWTSTIMKNLPVSGEALDRIRTIAWKLVNRDEFVQTKELIGFKGMSQRLDQAD